MGGGAYKGFIIGLFIITAAISRPFSGKLADTIGRVPVMLVGVIVCMISGFLYPLATTIWAFLGLRFFHGFSTGFKPTGTTAFASDVVPLDKKGEAMGLLGLFSSTGMAVGPYIGSLIVEYFSYNVLFFTCSAFSFLSILVLAGMRESLENPIKFHWGLLKIKKEDLVEKRILLPALITLCCLYSYGTVLTLVPDYSTFLGISNKGTFLLLFTLGSLSIRFFAGRLSDKYGRILLIKISTFVLGTSLISLAFTPNSTIFLLLAIPLGFGAGMNNPTIIAWAMDLADKKHIGRALSTFFLALEIGIGIGAFTSGWIFQNDVKNIPLCFIIAGSLCFLAFLILFLSQKKGIQKKE